MPHTEALILAGSLNLGLSHGDDGDGIAHGIEDFQLIAGLLAWSRLILLDHGGEIALAEAMYRNVLGKDDVAEEFVFHEEAG
jgi:hypothetical protein